MASAEVDLSAYTSQKDAFSAYSELRRWISGAYRFEIGQSVRTKTSTTIFPVAARNGSAATPLRSSAVFWAIVQQGMSNKPASAAQNLAMWEAMCRQRIVSSPLVYFGKCYCAQTVLSILERDSRDNPRNL